MSVQSLGSYIGRIRSASSQGDNITKVSQVQNPTSEATNIQPTATPIAREDQPVDLLANVRERQGKRPAFDYRPELADAKDLI